MIMSLKQRKIKLETRRKLNHNTCNDMKKMVPQPMNSMLDKQPREEAIRMREKRMNMVTTAVPPHSTIWYVFWNLKQSCLKSKVVD